MHRNESWNGGITCNWRKYKKFLHHSFSVLKAKILTLSPEPLIHLLCQDYFASLATWNDHFGQFHEQPEKCKNGKKGLLSQWGIRPHIYGVHMEGG